MNTQQMLLALFAFLSHANTVDAKFQYIYKGLAMEGVQACLETSYFTPANITARVTCRPAFECVMQNIPNHAQSILSSGSAILGFIPTVLLLLGNTNEDIIRISAHYPLLALFLSITNVNKRSLTEMSTQAAKSDTLTLGPYGNIPPTRLRTRSEQVGIIFAHFLTASGATAVIWQAVELGKRAVVTWACWTDFYPLLCVSLAICHHIIAVTLLRLSLRVEGPDMKISASRSNTRTNTSRHGLAVWKLAQADHTLKCTHQRFARWSKAGADFLNNLNYLYATAVFSSLTLVSGTNAIKVLVVFGAVAVVSRIVSAIVLESIDNSS